MHSLGDRHKVTPHIRVCHCDRPATCDLPFEERHNRTTTPEHVPKTDNRIGASITMCCIEENHLCQPFCCAHDVDGANGFIRRDENESFDFVLVCHFDDVTRAQNIVRYRVFNIGL